MSEESKRHIPEIYEKSYEHAKSIGIEAADYYLDHVSIGDVELDPVMEELATIPIQKMNEFIAAGIEDKKEVLKEAPEALREFFDKIEETPAWVDRKAFEPGVRAFHGNTAPILAAFVAGTLIEGFSTLISKPFFMTGRVIDMGVKRLRQNNRHQAEIFHPGGLMKGNDGWKLSIRIRFVHAQVRRLLLDQGEWNKNFWGMPISAANLGYAIACFSSRTLIHSTALGARFTPEQRSSFCAVWRYSGYLMGIPETILYETEQDALKTFELGLACEPRDTEESIIMSNTLINSAPRVAGITDIKEGKALANNIIYPISRALVGAEMADRLQFPACSMFKARKLLFLFSLETRVKKRFPSLFREPQVIERLFEASWFDSAGLTYDMPDSLDSEQSSNW